MSKLSLLLAALIMTVMAGAVVLPAHAQTYTDLHDFSAAANDGHHSRRRGQQLDQFHGQLMTSDTKNGQISRVQETFHELRSAS